MGEKEKLQRLLPREMVQITLHTPPTFTGCFHAECCPSKPSCTKKRGFYAPYTPVNATVFRLYALFAPEYSQTLLAVAWIRSEFGESYARKPGIQAHISVLIVPVVNLLYAAVSTSAAVLRLNGHWISCLPLNSVLLCGVIPRLSLPTIPVRHDGTYLHADHARLPWSTFLLRRGEVRAPQGGIKSL